MRLRQRKFAVTIFTSGSIFGSSFIFIGLFMRGPSWAWYWPWEDWTVAEGNPDGDVKYPPPLGRPVAGRLFRSGSDRANGSVSEDSANALEQRGYLITMVLLLLMIAVPMKIVLRQTFNIKYVLTTPWFNI